MKPKKMTDAMVAALVMPPEKLARALLTGTEAEHYVKDPEMPGQGIRLRQKPPRGNCVRRLKGLRSGYLVLDNAAGFSATSARCALRTLATPHISGTRRLR